MQSTLGSKGSSNMQYLCYFSNSIATHGFFAAMPYSGQVSGVCGIELTGSGYSHVVAPKHLRSFDLEQRLISHESY